MRERNSPNATGASAIDCWWKTPACSGTLPEDQRKALHCRLAPPLDYLLPHGPAPNHLDATLSFTHQHTKPCFFGHTHAARAYIRDASIRSEQFEKLTVKDCSTELRKSLTSCVPSCCGVRPPKPPRPFTSGYFNWKKSMTSFMCLPLTFSASETQCASNSRHLACAASD